MSQQELKDHYYRLGVRDAQGKHYPLWSTLQLAEEYVAAAAYMHGWQYITGKSLRFFRDSGVRR
jgi:hypothetical protein